jgi:hypothetical protein
MYSLIFLPLLWRSVRRVLSSVLCVVLIGLALCPAVLASSSTTLHSCASTLCGNQILAAKSFLISRCKGSLAQYVDESYNARMNRLVPMVGWQLCANKARWPLCSPARETLMGVDLWCSVQVVSLGATLFIGGSCGLATAILGYYLGQRQRQRKGYSPVPNVDM